MSRHIWKRTRLIYLVHLLVLVPAVLIIWALAGQAPPLANHFSDFLAHPWGSLALMPLLLHQPPLFDILPLYVIFLGVTPWLLAFRRRRGWGIILGISALGWLVAQFKWDVWLVGDPTRLLPLRWGSFDLLAWQFLWICGVAIGETSLRRQIINPGIARLQPERPSSSCLAHCFCAGDSGRRPGSTPTFSCGWTSGRSDLAGARLRRVGCAAARLESSSRQALAGARRAAGAAFAGRVRLSSAAGHHRHHPHPDGCTAERMADSHRLFGDCAAFPVGRLVGIPPATACRSHD